MNSVWMGISIGPSASFLVTLTFISFPRFQPDRQDHVAVPAGAVARIHDDGAQAIDQLQRAFRIRDRAQRVEKVPAVEADLHILPVARDLADVVCLADRGNGAEIRGILAEAAADGAFELLRDDEADTLDGIGHLCHVDRQLDRLVLRKHAPPVEEFTLEQPADERRFADRKEDMLAAEEEGAGLVGIAEDLFRFLERRGGDDEFERPPDWRLCLPAAKREPVAVDGDDCDGIICHLKQAAGMDGSGLVFADSEARAADHGLELALRQVDALFGVDLRQLRIILRGHGRNGEGGDPAADGDLEVFVDRDGDRIVRQLADDIEEESRRHDARAGLLDVRVNGDGDARLEIITGKRQLDTCADIDSLERRNGALLCDGTGGDGDGADQRIFFTGKFHMDSSVSSFQRKKGFFLEVRSSRGNLCGKPVQAQRLQCFFLHRPMFTFQTLFHTSNCETCVSQLSTEPICGFHTSLWKKSELAVDVRRNIADVVRQRAGPGGKLLLDLFERVNDGGMVAAEFLADVRKRKIRQLPDQIHGDLPRLGGILIFERAADDGFLNVVEPGDLADDEAGCRQIFGLFLVVHVLDGAGHVRHGQLHVVEVVIRADLFDGPLQQTHVRRDVFGDEGADIVRQLEAERDGFVLDDRHAGLKIGRLDVCDQAPLEPGLQPVFKTEHLIGRPVSGQNDLVVVLVEIIEGMEKFLLRGFLAGDKLDIIDEEEVRVAVFVAEFVVAALLQGDDELVGELVALDIDDVVAGMIFMHDAGDGIQQMRLAEAGRAVNEQRVIRLRRIVGDRDGRRVRKAVGRADDEIIKRELRVELDKLRLL